MMNGLRTTSAKKSRLALSGSAGAPATLALVLLGILAGCSSFKTFQIESRPPGEPVLIDGQADDWSGRLFVVEGQNVALGFMNDREFLYICLRIDDPGMKRQLLRSGMTVWFDPAGGKNKVLGIKYPVGLKSGGEGTWRVEDPEDVEAPGEVGGNLTDVEITRQGISKPEVMDIAEAEGFELKASASGSNFVYEIKVPLSKSGNCPASLGAAPGGTVGVGFETGKFDFNSLSRRPPGPAGGTGAMPPTGAYGNRGGGMRPGQMHPNNPEFPEELKIWATVELNPGGDPAPANIQSLSR
jgi:hypothetical protein